MAICISVVKSPLVRINGNCGIEQLVARQFHKLKAVGSNPTSATSLTTQKQMRMKLVKQGDNYIILSDADVAIQVIKQSEVIDGDKVIEAENAKKRYAAKVAAMSNEKLLDMLVSFIYLNVYGTPATQHKDHDMMGEAIYSEILNRMGV